MQNHSHIPSIRHSDIHSPGQNNQQHHRLIKALLREPVDRTPAWIMRQAGRYLPEYRKVRSRVKDFMTLCKTPELACQVTLQPIQRFPLDAAIIFSDILTIPDAYGLGLYFEEKEGPRFKRPIRNEEDVRQLPHSDPETELSYVMEAIRLTAHELQGKLPLIGFSGSPWTIATYMVEGQSSKHFNIINKMRVESPSLLHQLLQHLSCTIIDYLNAQIAAGVQVVMLFDTWGGILSRKDYLAFSLDYMTQIIRGVKQRHAHVPMILFTKNGGQYLLEMKKSGTDAIGLDWTADLRQARELMQGEVALQGNLEPAILYGTPERITQAVKDVLEQYGPGTGHVFNLGHGIHPDIDPERVSVMLESLHSFSPHYHQHREIA